jgi:hypothetical protein
VGAIADPRIRENERRACSDERARMAEKLRSNYQLAGQIREIRRAPADARSRNPIASSIRIHRSQRGVDVRPRKPLDAANRCAPDLHAVMIADWRRGMVARFKTGKTFEAVALLVLVRYSRYLD